MRRVEISLHDDRGRLWCEGVVAESSALEVLEKHEEADRQSRQKDALHTALGLLPEAESRLLRSHYGLDGLKIAVGELARCHGRHRNTIGNHLQRAREHLKKHLVELISGMAGGENS